jgi:hypothetical protein
MGRTPATDERGEEKAAFGASAPREGVEKTPEGSAAELAVLKVLVATQNEESVAAVSPLAPLSVAPVEVTLVAAAVVGAVVTTALVVNCSTAPGVQVTSTSVHAAK